MLPLNCNSVSKMLCTKNYRVQCRTFSEDRFVKLKILSGEVWVGWQLWVHSGSFTQMRCYGAERQVIVSQTPAWPTRHKCMTFGWALQINHSIDTPEKAMARSFQQIWLVRSQPCDIVHLLTFVSQHDSKMQRSVPYRDNDKRSFKLLLMTEHRAVHDAVTYTFKINKENVGRCVTSLYSPWTSFWVMFWVRMRDDKRRTSPLNTHSWTGNSKSPELKIMGFLLSSTMILTGVSVLELPLICDWWFSGSCKDFSGLLWLWKILLAIFVLSVSTVVEDVTISVTLVFSS